MTIYISKNLLNNLKKTRKKDWNENLNDNEIFEKINKILIHDKFTKNDENNIFLIINDKFQGIHLKEKNIVIYFTQMLSFNGIPRSRNTYINQNFMPAFYYSEKNKCNISVSINPFDLGKTLHTIPESIEKDFKTLSSLSISFNKSISINFNTNDTFKNLEEYIIHRNKLKLKNKGNNSTYIKIFDDEKEIVVYGKLDGANFSDTINTCRIIAKLNKCKFNLSFFELNSSHKKNYLNEISKIGFSIINTNNEQKILKKKLENIIFYDENQIQNFLKRNQKLFIKNIIQKYINVPNFDLHMCFACDYKIESNLIASHIYRYTDIINDFLSKKININLATHLITSGENGFLLCPNQDKEFEKGMIYFDYKEKKFKFSKKKLNDNQIVEIKKRIINQNFNNVNYTDEFKNNIKKHINRTIPY